MTDNYESVSCWGMFPAPIEQLKPESQFIQGYEAAFGLHLLEG